MKEILTISIIGLVCILVTSFQTEMHVDDEIPFPMGYRSWTHVKSGMLGPSHPNVQYRGFNHIYANDLAVEGYASGRFPDGSSIVVDVIEASPMNENYTGEGKRHHMDVMLKDSIKFSTTGGWAYAQFEGDNTPRMLSLEQKKNCYSCHLKQKDHIFSEMRK